MEFTELQTLFKQKFPHSSLEITLTDGFYYIVCSAYRKTPYSICVNTKIKSLKTLEGFLLSLEVCSKSIHRGTLESYFIPKLKAFNPAYTEDVLTVQNNRLYERNLCLGQDELGYVLKTWAVVPTNPASVKVREIQLPSLKEHQIEPLVNHLLTHKVKNNTGLDIRVKQLTQLCLDFTNPIASCCKIRNLYFITNGIEVKIGIANDVEKRLRTLQTANPKKLKVLNTIKGTEKQEKAIHGLLKQFPNQGGWTESQGEWFEIAKLPKDFYRLLSYSDLTPQQIIRFLNGRLRLWKKYQVQSITDFRKDEYLAS